ncbi:MAG: hypothetical protein GWO86_02390 [Planctomycetes bacterium]|nr:hypothetical protein [Planctomycetota bacterium]
MAEENKEYIEERLSSYIDDELGDRERNEVKRLIAHDADVKRRFEQLRKIKVLLNLAPVSEAPEHILENVKAQIERQILLGGYPQQNCARAGHKTLILRRSLTVAAILVLVAALAWVIVDVMVPHSECAAPAALDRPKDGKEILYERPVFDDISAKKVVVSGRGTKRPFNVRLEFTTAKAGAMDAFISKMILNSRMLDLVTSVDRQAESVRYSIRCSRGGAAELLAQMTPAWSQCENVQLSVAGETVSSFVTIDNVSITQAMDIFSIDQPQRRNRIIRELAVLNRITKPGEYQKSFAFAPDVSLLRPSMPVLTTARLPEASPEKSQAAESVNLTIIVR